VSCSNGTHASRYFLWFLLRWRQAQPRNRRNRVGNREERRPRAPRLPLTRLPRLTQRLHLMWRPLLAPRPLRRYPRHGLHRKSPRHVTRLRQRQRSARPRKRPLPRRDSLPVPPAARPPRPWRGTRRRRGPLRLQRSNSRKSPATVTADKPDRRLPNPARAAIWRAKPRQRALRQRRALGQRRRALRQQHTPLALNAMGLRNKM
jgi:hypothetical protein